MQSSFDDFKQQVTELSKSNTEQKSKLVDLQAQLRQRDQELSELRNSLKSEQNLSKSLKETTQASASNKEASLQEVVKLQRELADKDAEVSKLKRELNESKAMHVNASAKVDTNLEEARRLKAEEIEKKKQEDILKQQKKEKEDAKKKAEEELSKKKAEEARQQELKKKAGGETAKEQPKAAAPKQARNAEESESYDDDFDLEDSGAANKGKPGAASKAPSTKEYLTELISNNNASSSMFTHSQEEKLKSVKDARGQLQASSDALVKEKAKNLKLADSQVN